MFAPTITNEIKILELKELKAGNGVFIRRSSTKWTYTILTKKETHIQRKSITLRFCIENNEGRRSHKTYEMTSEQDCKSASNKIRLPRQH